MVEHVREEASDLVLLPEMPFHPWLAAALPCDPARWQEAVEAHARWSMRLAELGAAMVIGTRPIATAAGRYNEGFIWTAASGGQAVHRKYFLPDEAGFWEAAWYSRGKGDFQPCRTPLGTVGFLICTELWFLAQARTYAHQGVDLLVCPRATPLASVGKWLAGGRTAAVVSGAFCLSSNWCGAANEDLTFGGTGWIIHPEEGDVMGTTSPDRPFLTLELDLGDAARAKSTYPRCVPD